jgi:hypothetical protein
MEIANMVSSTYAPYIDCLYSSFQQFRIVGSHKMTDPNRTKKIDEDLSEWVHRGREDCEERDMLCASLISHVNKAEYIIVELPEVKINKMTGCETKDMDSLEAIVYENLKCFSIRGYSDGVYTLTRTRKNVECVICDRVHENENGFVYTLPDGTVIFRCFRDMSQSAIIGSLDVNTMMPNTKAPVATKQTEITQAIQFEIKIPTVEREERSTHAHEALKRASKEPKGRLFGDNLKSARMAFKGKSW